MTFPFPTFSPTAASSGDPNFASVKLLLGFEGADASTTLTDESSAPHTFTAVGNAQIDTAQFKYGTSAGLFDGAGDEWNTPDSADWRLSAANSDQFTVETWIHLASGSTFYAHSIIGQGDTNGNLSWKLRMVDTFQTVRFSYSPSGTGWTDITTSTGITLATWTHIMVDKDSGGKIRIYIDGVMRASSTPADSSFFNSTNPLRIGAALFGGDPMNGHLDELRITKGVARCGSDAGFTPPTAAFPRS